MIARLIGGAISAVVYFCAATLMAQVILGGYLCIAWKMDRTRAIQMLAIAQGIDLFGASRAHGQAEDKAPPEQPSLEQLIKARTAKDLDITIREQALQNGRDQLDSQERKTADNQGKFKRKTLAYETQLQELIKEERIAGRDRVRASLESVKAEQAQQLLALMLEKDEMDEVVLLVVDMGTSPQKKIFAEFGETVEGQKQLDEILRMIREGRPGVMLAEQTVDELARIGQTPQPGEKP